jgi:hypothetical protein
MPVTGFSRASAAILIILIAAIAVIAAVDFASAQTTAFGGPHPLAIGGGVGWVLAKQALFYRSLAGTIRTAKSDGSALWALMGISFVYGIFHAAGPGHGKAVIASYLFANEETLAARHHALVRFRHDAILHCNRDRRRRRRPARRNCQAHG